MKKPLTRSTVLITGATGFLGRTLARFFARKGARLILTGRDPGRLVELGEWLSRDGASCFTKQADLCAPETLEALAAAVEDLGWGLDILINNAADVTSKPLMDTSVEEVARLIETNVMGPLCLCRLLAPVMEREGGGAIVNISSLAGYKPNPAQTVYSVSKGAVNAMSEALQTELGPRGIRVINAALPSMGEARGQTPPERLTRALEKALEGGGGEVFLSPVTKWLMRLYRFYPPLSRLR